MSTMSRVLPAAVPWVNSSGLGLVRQPASVLFGPGQRRQAPRIVASLGRHALVVADARMATTAEFTELTDGLSAEGVDVSVVLATRPTRRICFR